MLWGCAQASTDKAWDTFRADVASRCERAAADQLDDIQISVDPFGSAHYGLALLNGTEHGADVSRSLICVYDKQEKTVELGTPFEPAAAQPAAAMPAQ